MVLTFLSSFIISGAATFLDNIEEIGWVHDTWRQCRSGSKNCPSGLGRCAHCNSGWHHAEFAVVSVSVPLCFARVALAGVLAFAGAWWPVSCGTRPRWLDVYLLRGGYSPYGSSGHSSRSCLVLLRVECDALWAEWGEVFWRLRDHRFIATKSKAKPVPPSPRDPLAPLPVLGTVGTASNAPPGYETDRPECRSRRPAGESVIHHALKPAPSAADVEGPWIDPDFDSGLIQRCKANWHTPISELTNEILATFLRQEIALSLVIPEARKRVTAGYIDDTELYEEQLSKLKGCR